jgi:hypothetical protein
MASHHLNDQLPAGEIALVDALQQIALVALAILADQRLGLGVGEVLARGLVCCET